MKPLISLLIPLLFCGAAFSQSVSPDYSEHKKQIAQFDMLDGTWVGEGWMITPQGERVTYTQTERVGSFLHGNIKMIEGRAYDADGSVRFNALGIISFQHREGTLNFRSYAMGREGDYVIQPTDNGFIWEIPMGDALIRYTAVISNDTWVETGERIAEGQSPFTFLRMELTRTGDTDWPAAKPVTP